MASHQNKRYKRPRRTHQFLTWLTCTPKPREVLKRLSRRKRSTKKPTRRNKSSRETAIPQAPPKKPAIQPAILQAPSKKPAIPKASSGGTAVRKAFSKETAIPKAPVEETTGEAHPESTTHCFPSPPEPEITEQKGPEDGPETIIDDFGTHHPSAQLCPPTKENEICPEDICVGRAFKTAEGLHFVIIGIIRDRTQSVPFLDVYLCTNHLETTRISPEVLENNYRTMQGGRNRFFTTIEIDEDTGKIKRTSSVKQPQLRFKEGKMPCATYLNITRRQRIPAVGLEKIKDRDLELDEESLEDLTRQVYGREIPTAGVPVRPAGNTQEDGLSRYQT